MKKLVVFVLAAAGIAACGGGGSGPSGAAFVKNQLNRTSDTAEPVSIDGLDLQFSERTSEFDSLFQ
ncbi:MAG: hypothetical protein IPJ77_16965 [Planctomycetes bacterium]|nr:hypothetical protein [Planctomycetota bacterium]